jgi:hypothetical protein
VNRPSGKWLVLLAVLAGGCSRSRPAPSEIHATRAGDVPIPSAGPWNFSHSAGTRSYRISRLASVQGIADSAARREVVTNFTHETLTFDTADSRLRFTAVVDTFAVTTQGVVGPAQTVALPIELNGTVSSAGTQIEPATSGPCNAARATAVTDLYNLIAPFPPRLTRGTTWRDSITVSGCQAGIPTTTTTRRVFSVTGEVRHAGQPRLLLTRTDTATYRGEGAYNQHRMIVAGTGTGTALYYLDTTTGEVSHLVTAQTSDMRVTSSGRVHTFNQSVNQEFVRVR